MVCEETKHRIVRSYWLPNVRAMAFMEIRYPVSIDVQLLQRGSIHEEAPRMCHCLANRILFDRLQIKNCSCGWSAVAIRRNALSTIKRRNPVCTVSGFRPYL